MTPSEAANEVANLRAKFLFGCDKTGELELDTVGLTPAAEVAVLQALCSLEQATHFLTAAGYLQAAALATRQNGGV
tara:strand:+ start:72 stop:299 length:228 start_codon:yes stop_codon:yes gene_type:complete